MSKTLEVLKSVKEKLDHNYTSYQLLSVLDKLLLRSIRPIINTTDYVDRVLANVVAWAAVNPRRKVTSLPKPTFNTYVMAYLASDKPEQKAKILGRMRLERNVLFFIASRFNKMTHSLNAARPSPSLSNALAVTHPARVYFASRDSQFWCEQASVFKAQIMEKYMRLAMVEAQMFYRQQKTNNPHLKFDLDELGQNFMLAVSKAVDKCDAQQGTLTTYVQNWIKDAKGNPSLRGEYGIAYTIPAAHRRTLAQTKDGTSGGKPHNVNISVSIDSQDLDHLTSDSDVEQEVVRNQQIRRVRLLAKRIDPTGIGRLYLGVDEILNDQELTRLLANITTTTAE